MNGETVQNTQRKDIALVAGNIVRLVSGGPSMTVVSGGCCGAIECIWFDRKGRLKGEIFLRETLELPHPFE